MIGLGCPAFHKVWLEGGLLYVISDSAECPALHRVWFFGVLPSVESDFGRPALRRARLWGVLPSVKSDFRTLCTPQCPTLHDVLPSEESDFAMWKTTGSFPHSNILKKLTTNIGTLPLKEYCLNKTAFVGRWSLSLCQHLNMIGPPCTPVQVAAAVQVTLVNRSFSFKTETEVPT